MSRVEDVWKTTSFSGDFNQGSKLGNSIFLDNTKGLAEADRLYLNKTNSLAIYKVFRSSERIIGDVISKTPTHFNADVTVNLTANLLMQYHRITLENVQRAAIAHYNVALDVANHIPPYTFSMKTLDPSNKGDEKIQFYKKFHSSVITHLIKNILSVTGYDDLLLQQEKFAFYNNAIGEM